MKKVKVEIEGICPILFNRFTDEAQTAMEKGTSGKKLSKNDKIKEAKNKVYRQSPRGEIGVPSNNIKKSMLIGCQMAGIKVGRRGAMSYMRATMFLDTDFVSFGVKKPDGIHECTGRIPPRTGARAVIRRPFLNTGWKLSFQLILTDERIPPETAKISLEEAGLLCGLCDHRPEYGRFKVNKFD